MFKILLLYNKRFVISTICDTRLKELVSYLKDCQNMLNELKTRSLIVSPRGRYKKEADILLLFFGIEAKRSPFSFPSFMILFM